MDIAYYNGRFSSVSEARIPLTDRVLFFGDGIYDVAIGKCGKIYKCAEHVRRFFRNASALSLEPGLSEDELCDLLYECIGRSGCEDFFLYFQLTGRCDERTHAYRTEDGSNLLITVKPFSLPEEVEARLIFYPDLRHRLCNVKTLNLLGAVLAASAAESVGADEAILVRDGYVTECAHSNIAIITDGVLRTPPLDEKILPGITRASLLSLCKKVGIPYNECYLTPDDVWCADDVLILSTTKLVRRATHIDGRRLNKKMTKECADIIANMRKDFLEFC